MAILKVARLGHPVLRKQAEPVTAGEIASAGFQQFLDDMVETMYEYEGVGLAAPQVHVSKQVFVCEVRENPRYLEAPRVPLTFMINPEITGNAEATQELWEGCLSIPDLRGLVKRRENLVCKGLDRYGKTVSLEASGFFARIVQHETDHLRGRVYLDGMEDLRSLTHLEEFSRYHLSD